MERARLIDGSTITAAALAADSARAGVVLCWCENCSVRVYLAGFRKHLPLASPVFRTWPLRYHERGCRYEDPNQTRSHSPRRRAAARGIVSVIDLRRQEGPRHGSAEAARNKGSEARESATERSGSEPERVVSTICKACEQHFADPLLNFPLRIVGAAGVTAKGYRSLFRSIARGPTTGDRIWFSALLISGPTARDDSGLSVGLYYYDKTASTSHRGEIVIDWRGWSARLKTAVETQIIEGVRLTNQLRNAAQAFGSNEGSRPKHPRIYFLGAWHRSGLRFIVDDHRCICVVW